MLPIYWHLFSELAGRSNEWFDVYFADYLSSIVLKFLLKLWPRVIDVTSSSLLARLLVLRVVCSVERIASYAEVVFICVMYFCQKHYVDVILLEDLSNVQFLPWNAISISRHYSNIRHRFFFAKLLLHTHTHVQSTILNNHPFFLKDVKSIMLSAGD